MSWMGTLAKVGMGVMVAKGVGKMISNRAGGGGASGGAGAGGLGGMLGGMMGGQGGAAGGAGGLGDLLGGMMGGQGGAQRGGGIGDVLGGMMGGGAAAGGLGSVLAGRGGNAGGGLGGLIDSLKGGASQGGAGMPPAPEQGGFGGALNSAFENFGEPAEAPTQSQEDAAKVMLRAMLSAAKSDGQIDEGEKEKILGQLGDISAEEMQFVRDELSSPLDVAGLVRDIPKGMEQQAYLMSVMGIDLDSATEARYLDGLAKALGIDAQVCNAIHDKVGAPKLYT